MSHPFVTSPLWLGLIYTSLIVLALIVVWFLAGGPHRPGPTEPKGQPNHDN